MVAPRWLPKKAAGFAFAHPQPKPERLTDTERIAIYLPDSVSVSHAVADPTPMPGDSESTRCRYVRSICPTAELQREGGLQPVATGSRVIGAVRRHGAWMLVRPTHLWPGVRPVRPRLASRARLREMRPH